MFTMVDWTGRVNVLLSYSRWVGIGPCFPLLTEISRETFLPQTLHGTGTGLFAYIEAVDSGVFLGRHIYSSPRQVVLGLGCFSSRHVLTSTGEQRAAVRH